MRVIYASYVAGIFRTLRFGTGEAHGRAERMEFNYLLEHGAPQQRDDGRYVVSFEAMPAAIKELATKLLLFEAHGDRADVEAWYSKYDVMPEALTKALLTTKDIPVDILPEFELVSWMTLPILLYFACDRLLVSAVDLVGPTRALD